MSEDSPIRSQKNRVVPMSLTIGPDGMKTLHLADNSIDDDPKYADIMKEVDDYVEGEKKRLGICNLYCWVVLDPIKKEYLKEKYGIEWLTTQERNPGVKF